MIEFRVRLLGRPLLDVQVGTPPRRPSPPVEPVVVQDSSDRDLGYVNGVGPDEPAGEALDVDARAPFGFR